MKLSKYNIIKELDDKILIYNSFSKASLFLEKDSNIGMFDNMNEFNKLDDSDKKILIENGFVIDDDRDELSELEYVFKQKYFDTEFFNIVLVPSLLCNFNCPYCFEKNFDNGKESVKKYFEVLKKFAKKNFKKHKIVQVSLFGGEPLLYADECFEFLKWVKKDSKKNNYEFFTSIVTNGSLMNDKILHNLLFYNLRSLQITIDSDKETHDRTRMFKSGKPSFDLLINIINNIAPVVKDYKNLEFIVRINLNNTTTDRVRDALKCIHKKNRKYIKLLIRAIYNTHAYNEDNTNNVNELMAYFDMAKDLGFKIQKEKFNFQTCEACGDRKFFYLLPDLSMRKCVNDLGFDGACIGKINDDGSVSLNVDNIVKWYQACSSEFLDDECRKCKKLPDCLGGCPLKKLKFSKKTCRTFDMFCLPNMY